MRRRVSIAQRQPLSRRIVFFLRIWIAKFVVQLMLLTDRLSRLIFPSSGPSYTKYYLSSPSLQARVFIPAGHKVGSNSLPLYIDIHGGGFAIGSPIIDDPDNLILSNTYGLCVVSIAYRLSPVYPFPTPVLDCAAMIRAVLDDKDLPFDRSKVAVGGYSAGGSLALASTQLDGLNKEVKAVVAMYAPTNSTFVMEEKLVRATPPPGREDILKEMIRAFEWGYQAPGTVQQDPLLNPHFAERDALPDKLYLIGCEYDLLCPEAEDTAEKYARSEAGEKIMDENGAGWTKGRVRWRKILGAEHGFYQPVSITKTREERERSSRMRADMHADVVRWLKTEVYI